MGGPGEGPSSGLRQRALAGWPPPDKPKRTSPPGSHRPGRHHSVDTAHTPTLNTVPLRGQSGADTEAFISGLERQNIPVQPFLEASILMVTCAGGWLEGGREADVEGR